MEWFRRIRWWLRRGEESRAVAEEMATHEALARDDYQRRGASPREAARLARRAMGNATVMREDARGVWLAPWLERLAQDVRYGLRSARTHFAFSAGVVAISALGIGATTTMFSLVDGIVLKPLPYPGADRLVRFEWGDHSPPRFADWQREITSVEQWAAVWAASEDLVGDGPPVRLRVARVSPDFLSVFAARPAVGRLLGPGDYEAGGAVVLLSHRLWVGRFGADSGIVGRSIQLGGRSVVVVGVLGADWIEPGQVSRPEGMSINRRSEGLDVWLPLVLSSEIAADWRYSILDVVGRLRPGLTVAGFRHELTQLAPRLFAANPQVHGDGEEGPFTIPVLPLQRAVVGNAANALYTVFAAVGLMLLIACANVINLYLARSTDRQRELAVRTAIGAGWGRLVRQLVTESLVLALIAGGLGVILAMVGVRVLGGLFPGDLPRVDEVAVNGRVLAFAIAVSVATGVMFGLVPARAVRRRGAHELIKLGHDGHQPRARLRSALLVAEVGLALMLTVGSVLLFRSLLTTLRVDPGFNGERLVVARLRLGDNFTPERRLAFAAALRDRLRDAPGVEAAAIGVTAPLAFSGGSRCCWGDNKVTLDGGKVVEQRVLIHPVGEGYLEAIGARVKGGTFTDLEGRSAPYPMVVSDQFASTVFGGSDAIGKMLVVGGQSFVVRGVVSGLKQWGLDQGAESEVFVPYSRFGSEFEELNVTVRSAGAAEGLVPVIRQAVAEIDPTLPATDVTPVSELIHRSLAGPRFYSVLMGAFAGLALLLAAAGVYASMWYTVRQRRRELGIRLALGAAGGKLERMVVGEAARLGLLGLAIGLVGAAVVARFLRGMLFGIESLDPTAFALGAAVLAATVLIAAYWPARRAGRADPLVVLRGD